MTIARLIQDRSMPTIQCTGNTLVRDAVALLANKRIGAMPVFNGDDLCGIFSERDVINQLHELGPTMLNRTVSELMSAPPVTVSPDTPVLDALSLMTRRRFRHLPVVQDGKMIDFISIGDLVKFRIDHIESEAEAMRSFIQMA
jgi:CBS domain-containing protein